MKKFKTLFIVFFLSVLTFSVVILPQYFSGQSEKDALNSVSKRSYNASERTQITSDQVARLYYNNEIVSNETTDGSGVSVVDVLDTIFAEHEVVYKPMKVIIENGEMSFTRENILINIDNQPTTLSFVECYVDGPYGRCDVVYEEKTNTVINLSFSFHTENFVYSATPDDYLREVESIMKDYYENTLKMSEGEYYFDIIGVDETSTGEWFDFYTALNTNDTSG